MNPLETRPNRGIKICSKLETVLFRRIVINTGTIVELVQRRQKQVSLGRVEVSAGRIGAQRPCGSLELFPGCEGECVSQEE